MKQTLQEHRQLSKEGERHCTFVYISLRCIIWP